MASPRVTRGDYTTSVVVITFAGEAVRRGDTQTQ